MSYLDRIRACNQCNPEGYRPFHVDGSRLGWVRHEFAEHLNEWPEVFRVSTGRVELNPALQGFEERSRAVAEVTTTLVRRGHIHRHHGEPYPVTAGNREQALFVVDRASASYFGIRGFGQHLNGFVRDGNELKMWIARRSRHKPHEPGKLDHLVAGGLPAHLSLADNLAKECWEEAAIPATLAAQARPVGTVSYCAQLPWGLRPDVIYCYDLELPKDFQPRCTDGEVEAFFLWPLRQVAERVRDSEDFKLNCNLVIIDFLVRHGYIQPDEPDYTDIVQGLHR
jgi:8-oxo-dGTP pyrophosphatase MutT (NUDIX family)